MIEEQIQQIREAYAPYRDASARDAVDLVTDLYALLHRALEACNEDLAYRTRAERQAALPLLSALTACPEP